MNLEKFFARLKTPSTVKGVVVLLGLFGVSVTPEYAGEIVSALGAVYAAIAVLFQES